MRNYIIGLLVLILTGIIVAVLVVSLGIVNIGDADPVVAPPQDNQQQSQLCGNLNQDEGEECDFQEPVECVDDDGYQGLQACQSCSISECESSEYCGDGVCNGTENSTTCNQDCAGTDITECSDGVDNDGDGAVDCSDLACLDSNGNCDPTLDVETEEGSTTQCSDEVDNDGDGLTDCDDSVCLNEEGICDPTLNSEGLSTVDPTDEEPAMTACSDGIDNDSDGLIDCEDLSCRDENDTCDATIDIEENDPTVIEKTLCNDEIDNDADGYLDCADVACLDANGQCDQTIDTEVSSFTCDDGLDNDNDGLVDCDDSQCIDSSTGKCLPGQNLEVLQVQTQESPQQNQTNNEPLPNTAIEIDTVNLLLIGCLFTFAGIIAYKLTLNHYLALDSLVGNSSVGRYVKRSNSAFFETSASNLVDEKIEKINNSTNEK